MTKIWSALIILLILKARPQFGLYLSNLVAYKVLNLIVKN